MLKVAGIILAAGSSSRFGSPKQLAKIDGQCMLQKVVDQSSSSQIDDWTVVLGAHHESIRSTINTDATILHVENWHQGLGVSLSAAVQNIEGEYHGLCIVLGDQAKLSSSMLNTLFKAFTEQTNQIHCASFDDNFGPPVIFPRHYFEELKSLSGDIGAKALIKKHISKTRFIEMRNAGLDVDTPDDLLWI